MPATKKRTYTKYTLAAAVLLGQEIKLERKGQKMTAQELAERLGVTRGTVQRLESGDPKVEIGITIDAFVILGIPLIQGGIKGVQHRIRTGETHLALLPKYVRPRHVEVSDDF